MTHELIQYQNANQSYEEVVENFVVRRKEFERVMAEIRNYDGYSSFQHTVFVGRRGSGKSTLLRRIQAELSMDTSLKERYEVVRLSEEQTFIYKLYDLWDYVIREMNVSGYTINMPDFRDYKHDMKQFSKKLHGLIIDQLKKNKKQLILLLDNIDRILSLGNQQDEASLLRELLINYKEIKIIGGSTVMSEHFWKYDQAFYQFFSIKTLEPLTNPEIKELFYHWSVVRNLPEIKDIIEKHPGKLQSIRMLTDGMPRTMLLFVDMLLNQSTKDGYQFLQYIVDKATPIYQERLALISEAQKKVFSELAFFWDAASVEDLIPKCNMEGKLISALLKQMTDGKYVEKIKGSTKNNLYRVEERFFNLWFNMTQGGLQHRAVAKALSNFLENWYDANELNSYCTAFSMQMSQDKMSQEYIKAMSHALMSSNIVASEVKRNFYKSLEQSTAIKKEDLTELKSYFSDIDQEIVTAFKKKEYHKAIELLHLSNVEEGRKYFGLGLAYRKLQNFEQAEKYYLKAINKGHVGAIYNLANLYIDQGKKDQAEKLYLNAIDKGHLSAMYNLLLVKYESGKKQEIKKLLNTSIEGVKDIWDYFNSEFATVLSLYIGDLDRFKKLYETFKMNGNASSVILINMLYLKQVHLVYQYFEKHIQAQEDYKPLYFAVLHLMGDKDQEILRMPPEIKEIVMDIMDVVTSKQTFYSKS